MYCAEEMIETGYSARPVFVFLEKLEQDWKIYPVLHLDLNAEKYDSPKALEAILSSHLTRWEDLYGKGKDCFFAERALPEPAGRRGRGTYHGQQFQGVRSDTKKVSLGMPVQPGQQHVGKVFRI